MNTKPAQLVLPWECSERSEDNDKVVNLPMLVETLFVLHLLTTIEQCDEQTFKYAGFGGLTYEELRDILQKALE